MSVRPIPSFNKDLARTYNAPNTVGGSVNNINEYLCPSGAYILVKALLIRAAEMLTDNKGNDRSIKDCS